MSNHDRYAIKEPITISAREAIYRAVERAEPGRNVALRILLTDGMDSESKRALLAVLRSSVQLSHPNIAGVLDVEERADSVYVAVEMPEGEPLSLHMENRRDLPLERKLEVMAQVAEGLAFAHGRGVVHGDLLPTDVVIPGSGPAKVLHFGRLGRAGRTDVFFRGMPADDAYDAAVLSYRWLGTNPSTGGAELRGNSGEWQPLQSNDARIPSFVDDAVRKGVSTRVEDRYASASDLAEALRAALARLAEQRVQLVDRLRILRRQIAGLKSDLDVTMLATDQDAPAPMEIPPAAMEQAVEDLDYLRQFDLTRQLEGILDRLREVGMARLEAAGEPAADQGSGNEPSGPVSDAGVGEPQLRTTGEQSEEAETPALNGSLGRKWTRAAAALVAAIGLATSVSWILGRTDSSAPVVGTAEVITDVALRDNPTNEGNTLTVLPKSTMVELLNAVPERDPSVWWRVRSVDSQNSGGWVELSSLVNVNSLDAEFDAWHAQTMIPDPKQTSAELLAERLSAISRGINAELPANRDNNLLLKLAEAYSYLAMKQLPNPQAHETVSRADELFGQVRNPEQFVPRSLEIRSRIQLVNASLRSLAQASLAPVETEPSRSRGMAPRSARIDDGRLLVAERAFNRGDYDLAIRETDWALRRDPGNEKARQLRQRARAAKDFEAAALSKP